MIVAQWDISVRGSPSHSVELAEWARGRRADGVDRTGATQTVNAALIAELAAWRSFVHRGMAVASDVHIAIVEIDGVTSEVQFEEVRYDQDRRPLTGTILDYALPKATQLPTFELAHVETPTPCNPLGAKWVGAALIIAAPPAGVNAVPDALAHVGISFIGMPLRPERR